MSIVNLDIEKIYNDIDDIKQYIISSPIQTPILTNNQNKTDNLLLQELINKVNKLEKTNEKLEKTNEKLEKTIEKLEKSNIEVLEKLNNSQTRTTTGFNEPLPTVGPRLQQIHPETNVIVKVYETVAECVKASNYLWKRPSLDKAIKENTIYQGFRWQYVDRSLDPNIIHNLQPTRNKQVQNGGYIAKINKEQTQILAVYLDRKTACLENGYSSASVLDEPVKKYKIANNHYYKLFDDCDEAIQEEFIQKNNGEQPILYKDGIGQYDLNNHLIKEFVCKNNCGKALGISDKSLTKAIDQNIPYNGYYYKRLGEKLVIQ